MTSHADDADGQAGAQRMRWNPNLIRARSGDARRPWALVLRRRLAAWPAAACACRARACRLRPRQPPPSDARPTTSVDLSRTAGENTTFHETATERQKFQVHIDFGKIFDAQGNLDRAVQEYQDALKVAEARGTPRAQRGRRGPGPSQDRLVLDRLGRFPQAEDALPEALKLSPRDPRSGTTSGIAIISRDAGPTPSAPCGPR